MGDLYFMPSDVARIVLGYLKESSYNRTYNCFLKECSHLKEIYNLEKAGRSLRKVTQFNLCKILEEWGHQKYSSENSTNGGNNFIETPSSDETVDETLVCDNDVTNSGRKAKARARSSAKKSPQVLKVRRSPCTPKSSRLRTKSPRSSNASNEQVAKVTESIVRTSDRLVSENSNTGNLNESTPQKSPLSTKREDLSGKAIKTDSFSPSSKDKGVKINDTKVDTEAEVPNITKQSSVRSPANNEDGSKTCYPESRQSKKDSEQSDNIGNKENKDRVNKGKLKGQLSDKEKEIEEDRCVLEPKHRKTKETSEPLTNTSEIDEASTAAKYVMSETFVKTVPESPCNNAANERCLEWLKKNNEVIKSRERCDTNGKYEHSGSQNLDGPRNVTQPVQQDNTGHVDVKTQAAHIDECSNEVTTSKSSVSTETVRSVSPLVAPDTGTFEKASNKPHTPQPPLHVTPKKMSPEVREKNLVTLMKPLLGSDSHTSKSPRRKKPKTPRKRHSEVSPVSVVSVKSVDPSSVNPIFEKILADHRLHEKLAETCNLVHSQIRLANSGKENKSDTKLGEQISPVPTTSHSYDQETVTASQSLEEILGLDHNFHADMLSDNIDMSDPAYASLFKLFGTDRETFNEYLRKEKEKELALMEAEVEELERSNHEILCANFGMSNADAGYETQELAYSSPHHVALAPQDLFSTHHGSPRTLTTSTPCGNNVPVNFTPVLRGGIGNSPVHSSNVFGGMKNPGMDNKISPSSTATQPFSPAHSHYSEVNNPPTPGNQQHLSTYVNPNSPRGSNTPRCHMEDPYSNPATPLQSNTSQVMHSTPTGTGNPEHFHHSSPIHSQHSAVKNSHAPVHCSPLVKADIHPHSPLLTNTNGYHSDNNNGLYFHSHITNAVTNQNGNGNNGTHHFGYDNGYLHLLQNDVNIPPSREPCTTIENTIGCISLPQPEKDETKQNVRKKSTSRSRRKKEPVKRKNVSASHTTVKSLLEKPLKHLNRFPLSLKIADLQQVCRTPEKRPENLTFRSPGGKTMINVPVLNCEDQIDLSVLGMDENIDATDSTVNVYDHKLDTSTQYSIAPENQATHHLISAIEAGKTLEVVQEMNKRRSDESKPKTSKRTITERKTRPRKKKEETDKEEQKVHFSPTPPSSDQHEEGILDPNQEVYTATPFTSLHKAATVRALNFGPNVDDPEIAHYRKIYPKLQVADNSPSVLILSTNQVINPGQNVIVSSTPITLVQNMPKQTNAKVVTKNNDIKDEGAKESLGMGRVKGNDIQIQKPEVKTVARSGSVRESQENKKVKPDPDIEVTEIETKSIESTPKKVQLKSPSQLKNTSDGTPRKLNQSPKQVRNLSKEMVEESLNSSNEEKSLEKVIDIKTDPEATEKCSLESNVQPEADIKTKSVVFNCKKIDNSSKTSKSRSSKAKEKLKVKIPCHKSPKGKQVDNKHAKTGIPFYFKKKNATTPDNVSYSSDEDVPLSVLKMQQLKGKKKESKSVEIIVESESTDDDGKADNVKSTHSNSKEKFEDTSKELLFEKIGLTPTKSLCKNDFKSPNRANALDVMAEWQRSPLSERGRALTPNTRNRFSKVNDALKSPTTPKRKTPAKQLFASPIKEKNVVENVTEGRGKHTAKRVDKIIDRLKQNNPGRNLDSVKRNKNGKKSSRNGKETIINSAVSGNETEEIISNKKKKEKKSLEKEKDELLQNQVNEEEIFANRNENNLIDDEVIYEKEDLNNSVIENVNEKAHNNSVIENVNEKAHNNSVIESVNEKACNNSVIENVNEKAHNNSVIENVNEEAHNNSVIENINEEAHNNSVIENINEEVVTRDDPFVLDENSQGASELHRAVASIEFDHSDFHHEEEQIVTVHQYNEDHLNNIYPYSIDEEPLNKYGNTMVHCTDIPNSCEIENISGQTCHLPEKQLIIRHEQLVEVDVHRSVNDQDSREAVDELQNSRHNVEMRKEQTDSPLHNTGTSTVPEVDQSKSVTQTLDNAESLHDHSKVESVNSEHCKRKSKKKKRKHRHCHRHSKGSGNEVSNVGDQFISPGVHAEGEHHRHSHKKKKKKSKKRHRDESEDGHESKRRRKEKRDVSFDSLASLNVDEALKNIYGGQASS